MSSATESVSNRLFPLTDLLMANNAPYFERVFGYLDPEGRFTLSCVCKIFTSFSKTLTQTHWLEYLKQYPKWSVIDQTFWKSDLRLIDFLRDNGLDEPTNSPDLSFYRDVLPGLRFFNSLELEEDQGMSYILLPKGLTFRMACTLFAKILDRPTCFTNYQEDTAVVDLVPANYWDTPLREDRAFFISNSCIKNSQQNSQPEHVGISDSWGRQENPLNEDGYPGIRQLKELLVLNNCKRPDPIQLISLLALSYIKSQDGFTSESQELYLYSDASEVLTWTRVGELLFGVGYLDKDGFAIFEESDQACWKCGITPVLKLKPA